MPTFVELPPELAEKIKRTPPRQTFDYTFYERAIKDARVDEDGFSGWSGMRVDGDADSRTERRRLSRAATLTDKHVQYHKDSTDKLVIWRVRPAPVART